MANHNNMQTGLEGETWVSEALDGLKIDHNHHDFSSITAYSQTQNKGVDIWNGSLNFYIEVKHFPNSYLCDTECYYAHIESRFCNIPINGFKLVVQIKGWKNRSFIAKLKQMGIYYIYVDDPKKLVSKLGYFLRIYGIMPEPHKDSRPHKRTTTNGNEYELEPLVPVSSPVSVSSISKEPWPPPDCPPNLSVSYPWFSRNFIKLRW